MAKFCEKTSKIKGMFFLTMIILILFSQSVLASQDVKHYERMKKIKLFESTVLELEKLFKFPKKEESAKSNGVGIIYYELKNATLTVTYSLGRCGDPNNNVKSDYFKGYDVGKGVIVDLHLLYSKYPLISTFHLDLSSYKTEYNAKYDLTKYSNDEIGIVFTGTKMDFQSIELNPTQSQEESYDCVKLGK